MNILWKRWNIIQCYIVFITTSCMIESLSSNSWSHYPPFFTLSGGGRPLKNLFFFNTWMFPKIGVPPKSSILIGFSIIHHPFWGTPNFWKHPNQDRSFCCKNQETKMWSVSGPCAPSECERLYHDHRPPFGRSCAEPGATFLLYPRCGIPKHESFCWWKWGKKKI